MGSVGFGECGRGGYADCAGVIQGVDSWYGGVDGLLESVSEQAGGDACLGERESELNVGTIHNRR